MCAYRDYTYSEQYFPMASEARLFSFPCLWEHQFHNNFKILDGHLQVGGVWERPRGRETESSSSVVPRAGAGVLNGYRICHCEGGELLAVILT